MMVEVRWTEKMVGMVKVNSLEEARELVRNCKVEAGNASLIGEVEAYEIKEK